MSQCAGGCDEDDISLMLPWCGPCLRRVIQKAYDDGHDVGYSSRYDEDYNPNYADEVVRQADAVIRRSWQE